MDTTQGDEDSLQNCNNTMKIIAPGRIKVASGSKDADGILMKSLSFQHGHHTHLSGTFFFMMRCILFIRMELTSVRTYTTACRDTSTWSNHVVVSVGGCLDTGIGRCWLCIPQRKSATRG